MFVPVKLVLIAAATLQAATVMAQQSIEQVAVEMPAPKMSFDATPAVCKPSQLPVAFAMDVAPGDSARYQRERLVRVLDAWGRRHLAAGKSSADCPVVNHAFLVGQWNLRVMGKQDGIWSSAGLRDFLRHHDEARARVEAREVALLQARQEQRAKEDAQHRKQAEAERAAAQQRRESAMRALLLPSSSPQALYLRAGGFERDSEMDSARRVYEYLIVTFPTSSWAVKANDRLLAMKAEAAAAEGARAASPRSNPTVAPDRRNGNAAAAPAAMWALEDERQREQEQWRQNAERAEKERQQREREEAESFRQRNEQIRRQQEQWAEEERRRRQ